MAKLVGPYCNIFLHGYDLTGYSNQWDVEEAYTDLDLTSFGDGVENSAAGIQNVNGSLASFIDALANRSYDALKAPGGFTNKVLSILIGQNAAPTIGDPMLALLCKQFSASVPLDLATARKILATFKAGGDYKLDMGKVLANTSIAATTNFTEVDNTALSANGGVGYLHILTPTTTDTYVIKIQHAVTLPTYADLITFTLNGTARGSERIAVAGTVNRYLRCQATRTGTGQTLTLACEFARY
jgi:hypothetical protein